MSKRTKSLFLLFPVLLISCSYDPPSSAITHEETISSEVDLSRFFVLGDRFSSGFMDGALYSTGQKFSYPNLVATKIDSLLMQRNFYQPEVSNEFGYNPEASSLQGELLGKYKLEFLRPKSPYPSRVSAPGFELNSLNVPFSNIRNFSIPGMKVYEADNIDSLQNNEYYNWIFDEAITPSNHIIRQNPGLVLISLGMEDIFSFTYYGAAGDTNKNLISITEKDLITSTDFEASIEATINKLLVQTEAEVLITTLFNPLFSPHFNTIGWELEPEFFDNSYLDYLEDVYLNYNQLVNKYNYSENGGVPDSLKRFVIKTSYDLGFGGAVETRNRILIDENLTEVVLNDGTVVPKYRNMYLDEVIPFYLVDDLNMELGLSGEVPLNDSQVILSREILLINNKIKEFNSVIRRISESNDRVQLIDLEVLVEAVNYQEYSYEGIFYSNNFDKYSIFSADGYTFNRRGNAIVANLIIDKLNSTYGTRIERFNPNSFKGIDFEFTE